jgi:glyoxylase-like metal-dependent hydrolase (beta-lactamase superfamily II)
MLRVIQVLPSANISLLLGKEITLIDTGLPVLSLKPLLRSLKQAQREINEIQQIICTHGHFDHIGSANQIKRVTGAKLFLHSADAEILGQNYSSWIKNQKFSADFVSQMQGWHRAWISVMNTSNYASFKYFIGTIKPDEKLETFDHLDVSGLGSLEVISTPGHTRGSICLWHETLKVLFTGDTILARGGKLGGPKNIFSESEREGRKNIAKLLGFRPKVCVPGHFRLFSGEALQNISKLIPLEL